jgi:N-acetylglucosamine kinase-like BadF-type ATPase
VAQQILLDAADELALAARTVRDRLRLEEGPYDTVLSGGTFAAVPTLVEEVLRRVKTPRACVFRLQGEPALGAVRLALEELEASERPDPSNLHPRPRARPHDSE